MPPLDDQGATVVVIELGPGLVYVKIAEPKPEPRRVEMLLRRTIDAWFGARPQLVIDGTQPVVEADEILGIEVWYHAGERRALPPLPAPADCPASLTIEVSEPVLKQLPKEYIEAVIEEAIQIWRSHHDRHGTLVVVNARQIAVILDGRASRGVVLPVEALDTALDDETRRQLQTWLGSLPTRLHVFQVAENRFGWQGERVRIAEPNFVIANMTYDSGNVKTNMTYDRGEHPGA
jgi:hypothetical protein